MYKSRYISALLLIGGIGTRFKSSLPKQFHVISGKKIYLHTLDAFLKKNIIDEIILVCHIDWIERVKKETAKYNIVKVVEGGKTRQISSYNGLLACEKKDIVLIHDAVRPFVSGKIIIDNIESAIEYGAVDTCIKSTDTLVHIQDKDTIDSIPDRSHLLRGQTPQSFKYALIMQAHKKAMEDKLNVITDDCGLIMHLGKKVKVVKGCDTNIKITSPLDIYLAEHLLRTKASSLSPFSIIKKPLTNKKYAVIGASGGIGSAICEMLKQEGAYVFEISRSAKKYRADLNSYDDLYRVFLNIYKNEGPLDGLINSAGALLVKNFYDFTKDEIDNLINVNLTGLIYACRLVQLRKNAHIINISSSSFAKGRKNYGIYSATKAAVVNFTQALAEEFPNYRINTIIPQRTNTTLRSNNFPNEDKSSLLCPKKIAENVLNLLKESITGSLIEVRK
jgi:ribitol-5-phosphate 2-dehydrogenase (NADP+) / D-ribitol-5-phosphate cytidylyltransferase